MSNSFINKTCRSTPRRFERRVSRLILFGLLLITAGCSRLFAQQFPTQGLVIEILPVPEDWFKTQPDLFTGSPDGMNVSGSNWSNDDVEKTFVWTKKNGFRMTGRKKQETQVEYSKRVKNYLESSEARNSRLRHEEWIDKHLPAAKKQIGDWVSDFHGYMTPDGQLAVGTPMRGNTIEEKYRFIWREDMGLFCSRSS